MGASAPHPHGQVWTLSYLPQEPAVELENLRKHTLRTGHCLLCSYPSDEMKRKERIVEVETGWVAVVPFWAVWPFEVLRARRATEKYAERQSCPPDILVRYLISTLRRWRVSRGSSRRC